jgi:hypothetical protein
MNIWTVLKTLFFTTTMLLQSILSTIAYSRPVTSTVAVQAIFRAVETGVLLRAGCVECRRGGQ